VATNLRALDAPNRVGGRVKPGHDAKPLGDLSDAPELIVTNSKRYKREIKVRAALEAMPINALLSRLNVTRGMVRCGCNRLTATVMGLSQIAHDTLRLVAQAPESTLRRP
jgi:hypothetical protein